MEQKEKKYYLPQRVSKTQVNLYETDKETHDTFERELGAFRKRMQRSGECLCTKEKTWQCDGCCVDCPYYLSKCISMEQVVSENQSDGSVLTVGDQIADPDSEKAEERHALAVVFETLCQYLDTLDPVYRQIFDFIKSKTDVGENVILRKVAEEINMPWSTFKSRLQVIREAFKTFK